MKLDFAHCLIAVMIVMKGMSEGEENESEVVYLNWVVYFYLIDDGCYCSCQVCSLYLEDWHHLLH